MPRESQPHVRPPARARLPCRILCVPVACGIAVACFADTLQLSSGETLVGEVISEDGSSIVFESAGLGKVKVPRDRIARIVKEDAAVAKAAPAPGAQEPTAPEAQPGEAVAQITPAPAEKKKREDLLRLWWEDNLRYQFYQPITVPMPFSGGERTVGEDVRISGRAGLRMSVDAADFISTGGEPPA